MTVGMANAIEIACEVFMLTMNLILTMMFNVLKSDDC